MKKTHLYRIWGLTAEQFKACAASEDYVCVVTDLAGNYSYALGRYNKLELILAKIEAFWWNVTKGYKYKFERVC